MARKTQAELSKALRCSRQAISAHLARPDAPRPDDSGRYDAGEVRAFVRTRRALDNRATSAELLEQRIENLRLENTLLKQRLRIDRPAFPPEVVEQLLRDFLNEMHCNLIGQLNNVGYLVAQESTPGACIKHLHEALTEAEGSLCRWMTEHKLQAPDLSADWPIPLASFGWWFKGAWRLRSVSPELAQETKGQ